MAVMTEADFSGYATKADIKCSDGRTIKRDAFAHQDGTTVPLVWHHRHDTPENVLGHAVLENRADGVYTYAFFNKSKSGQDAKALVQHGDVKFLSIYANQLIEKSKAVLHGAIREVSIVLAGANPEAKIDYVQLAHGDGNDTWYEDLEDEAVIKTGLEISISHADEDPADPELEHAVRDPEEIYNSMDEDQKKLTEFLVDEALKKDPKDVQHSDVPSDPANDPAPGTEAAATDEANTDVTPPADAAPANSGGTTPADPANDPNPGTEAAQEQGTESNSSETGTESGTTDEGDLNHQEGNSMSRNIFDQNGTDEGPKTPHLTHAQIKTIVEDGARLGSLKESFLAHAQEYGVEDIDILFPDAKAVANSPEVIGRRQEWVADVISKTKHSPFSRIKSTAVDLTADEARAKGYVKGNLKKEEIIKLLKRVTTPTTIYKKQKLDRDDIVDITDLNVVVWLKAEMRVMLDEELARAVLIGDGREADDEDAIDVDHLRPIAYDADMYAHQLTIASELSPAAIIKTVLRARTYYKGTGTPTLYTTDAILTDLILLEDKVGRRLYETEQALAAALRVDKIVTVPVMEDNPDIVGVIVNLVDYTLGADQGGSVAMFDDFDIDYNQYKYLIETRVSGALTKPKSAIVLKRTLGTVVTPTAPSYNGTTHTITFPSTAGVVYSIDGETQSGDVVIEDTTDVEARPATGYSFPPNTNRDWTYTA